MTSGSILRIYKKNKVNPKKKGVKKAEISAIEK